MRLPLVSQLLLALFICLTTGQLYAGEKLPEVCQTKATASDRFRSTPGSAIQWVIAFGYGQLPDEKVATDPVAYNETLRLLHDQGFKVELSQSNADAPHRKTVLSKTIRPPGTSEHKKLEITLLYSALSVDDDFNRKHKALQKAQSEFVFSEVRRLRDEAGAPVVIFAGHAGNGDGLQRGPLPKTRNLKWIGQKVDSVLPWGNRADFIRAARGGRNAAPLSDVLFVGCNTDQHYRGVFGNASSQILTDRYVNDAIYDRDKGGGLMVQSLFAVPVVRAVQKLVKGESARSIGDSMEIEVHGVEKIIPGQGVVVTTKR